MRFFARLLPSRASTVMRRPAKRYRLCDAAHNRCNECFGLVEGQKEGGG